MQNINFMVKINLTIQKFLLTHNLTYVYNIVKYLQRAAVRYQQKAFLCVKKEIMIHIYINSYLKSHEPYFHNLTYQPFKIF